MPRVTPIALALSSVYALIWPGICLAGDAKLAEVVVTATKTQQSIKDVSASVSVITRERIEQSSATTVDQLLQGTPGVYAARMDASSPNRIAQTYTRGLPGNSRTLVLLDGIPMNVLYDGQVDWSQLSTQDIERVEVVRGASSGLYGSNAMGGVINILSRAPEPGRSTRLSGEYGSMNSTRISAAHSNSFGATALSLSASHFKSDGYNMWRPDTTVPVANQDAIGTIKDNATVKLLHELDSQRMVEAGLSYMRDEATGFYKPGTAGYTPQTREQYVPSVRFTLGGEDAQTSITAYSRIGKQWADTLTTPAYISISEKGEYNDQTLGLSAQHTRSLGQDQRLSLGADYLNGEIENHFTYPGSTRLRDTFGDLTRYGFFIQDEITPSPRWRVNVALRYDHWKTGGNQTDTGVGQPNSAYTTRKDEGISPKLSALFKLTEQVNLRASAGQAFNLPDMFNLYANTRRGASTYWANSDLKPETVNAYDLGLDYYFSARGQIKVTVYRNDAEDFIYTVQRNATNFDKVNVGGVKTEGVELELAWRPLDRLNISASATFNDSVIVRHDRDVTLVGKGLTNVPAQQANLRAEWTWPGGAMVYANMNYVDDRFGNDTNTTIYKGYTTYDLGGQYPLRKDIIARLTWANITDKKYDGIGYIAPGATVTGSVSAKF